MNPLNDAIESELPAQLLQHCRALAATSAAASDVERAQAKLEKLSARGSRRAVRVAPVWLGALAATACLVVVLTAGPALIGGGDVQGAAFATVQKNLREFRTLDMRIEQRVAGETLPGTHVRVDRDGNVRTDIGTGMSIVVNATEGRVLTLMHDSREALVAPLPGVALKQEESLAWLRDIETFKGVATRLPEPRLVDGQRMQGWALKSNGTDVILWADAQGWPRAMTVGATAQLELHFRFSFNEVFAPDVLSTAIPHGYRAVAEDEG